MGTGHGDQPSNGSDLGVYLYMESNPLNVAWNLHFLLGLPSSNGPVAIGRTSAARSVSSGRQKGKGLSPTDWCLYLWEFPKIGFGPPRYEAVV